MFRLLHQERKQIRRNMAIYQRPQRHPLPLVSQMLISDIDNTLLGDRAALRRFLAIIAGDAAELGLWCRDRPHLGKHIENIEGMGRSRYPMYLLQRSEARSIMVRNSVRISDGRISSNTCGAAMRWRRRLREVPGLTLQSPENQREFKLSYNVDPEQLPPISKIRALLREQKSVCAFDLFPSGVSRHFASARLQRTGNTLSRL